MEGQSKLFVEGKEVKFRIGQFVFLRTDPEQVERLVVGYIVRATGILYEVAYLNHVEDCYDIQLSATRDEVKRLGVDKNSN